MKKLFSLLFFCLFVSEVFSQNDVDVMRYSQTTFSGDARFMAMAGSFGALGANMSCINFNPAGLAVYRKGEWNFTTGMRFANTNANHYGTSNTDFKSNLVLPNIGMVSAKEATNPYTTDRERKRHPDWSRRFVFAFSYNKIANFNNNTTIQGDVYNNSICNDFVNAANGKTAAKLDPFYEGLAWNTYLINEYNTGGTSYWGMVDPNKTIKQTKTISTVGGMGEYSLALAYAIDNKLYLGASLGIVRAKFTYDGKHEEQDDKDSIAWFKSMYYEEIIQSSGWGVNLKLGAIYRINPMLRIGASVNTPTRISMNDIYRNNCSATYDSDTLTPSVIRGQTITDSDTGRFKYKIVTPMRATASIAYLANKFMAVNVDYEYVNYGQGNLQSTPMVFADVNRNIRSTYKSSGNLRIGLEANIRPVILRAGFATYGSPLGMMFTGNSVRNSYTLGAGFKHDSKWYIDLALVITKYKEDYYLYSPALINASKLNYTTTTVLATIGKRF